jgi:hypothetical protein
MYMANVAPAAGIARSGGLTGLGAVLNAALDICHGMVKIQHS